MIFNFIVCKNTYSFGYYLAEFSFICILFINLLIKFIVFLLMEGKFYMRKFVKWLKEANYILIIAYLCTAIGLYVLGHFLIEIKETYCIGGNLTPEEMAQTGQVGDFIGGVIGSIWALAGVLLYFSALRLQQQELKSQRDEMVTNQKILDQQLFETTFFNLLKVQDNIRNSIKTHFYYVLIDDYNVEERSINIDGSDFFYKGINEFIKVYSFVLFHKYEKTDFNLIKDDVHNFYVLYYNDNDKEFRDENEWLSFKQWIHNQYRGFIYYVKENTLKNVQESNDERRICAYSYWLFYHKYENCLGHYCRHFYNIIKYLDSYKRGLLDKLDKDSSDYLIEKKKIEDKIHSYFSFAQSGLSSSELVMLYYNMLLFPNAEHLYSEYNIFENMHIESLIKTEHSKFFPKIEVKSVERFKDLIWKPSSEN